MNTSHTSLPCTLPHNSEQSFSSVKWIFKLVLSKDSQSKRQFIIWLWQGVIYLGRHTQTHTHTFSGKCLYVHVLMYGRYTCLTDVYENTRITYVDTHWVLCFVYPYFCFKFIQESFRFCNEINCVCKFGERKRNEVSRIPGLLSWFMMYKSICCQFSCCIKCFLQLLNSENIHIQVPKRLIPNVISEVHLRQHVLQSRHGKQCILSPFQGILCVYDVLPTMSWSDINPIK